jgi:predicted ATPase
MPTGDHIPFLLEQLLQRDSAKRNKLLKTLKEFGDESGLFKSFQVRHLGDRATDPFQLLVTVAGRASNLVDVGYGVSQALPVIVQASLMEGDQTLLLQQPEVHLHPRAQAALGTFFAVLAASGSSRFLVETHSDYIIDRVRQEVTKKTIPLEKVGILYFQRNGMESGCSLLDLDSNGNIVNPPPDYRNFFLHEEVNLLTRTERSN